jgi:hypothetical protein
MPKRAAPGGADGDAAATASAMDAHRLGRRWVALALADIAGWPLDKIRKKIRGTTATSLKRWREALRARDDVADAPRSGAEHRRVTEADLDLVRAAIEEPLAAGGRHRKRSLKRSRQPTAGGCLAASVERTRSVRRLEARRSSVGARVHDRREAERGLGGVRGRIATRRAVARYGAACCRGARAVIGRDAWWRMRQRHWPGVPLCVSVRCPWTCALRALCHDRAHVEWEWGAAVSEL